MKFGHLLILAFAWTLYTREVKLQRRDSLFSYSETLYESEDSKQKKKLLRRAKKRREKVRDTYFKHRKVSTRPRDHRFSNQRSLRRMYRSS